MSIENLLSRLDKVKSTGKDRWHCLCPAHDDKSPSMHIKLDGDGKILINCKASCEPLDILSAIGLEFGDLFPNDDRKHIKSQKRVIYASEALELLRHEAMLVLAGAYSLRNGTLTTHDLERLEKTMEIINRIYELSTS
jgi:hypothetical protein